MILVDAVQKYDVLLETLFACLLLVVCEVLRGSDVAAQYHLDGAIHLLSMPSVARSQFVLAENDRCTSFSPVGSGLLLLKELSLIFQQLDLQAAAFLGSRLPISPENIDSITQYPAFGFACFQDAQIAGRNVNSGSTIEELRQNLLSMQAKVSRFIDSKTVIKCKYRSQLKQTQNQEDEFNAVKGVQETLLEQLEHWKINFDTISSEAKDIMTDDYVMRRTSLSKEGLNPIKQCATIVMLLSYLTSYVLLSTSLSPDELAYDSHSATFAHIIELSEIFLQQQQQLGSGALPSFSIDMKVIYPLYITALKFRDCTTRHRAIHLLSMCGRESVWDGRMMASIAQSVIACEEEYAFDQSTLLSKPKGDELPILPIPERARIHGVGIVDMDRQKGELKMVCFRKTGVMTVNTYQDVWERILLYARF
jgi:hypothetical protein